MRTLHLFIACLVWIAPVIAADHPIPWPEHPRPDRHRAEWVNLNGPWQFDFDARDAGMEDRWFEAGKHRFERTITVPFPWESRLSGVGDVNYRGVAWYARDVQIPSGAGWDGKDAWLIVGACDFEAKVWVNGKPAGEFVGGYLPFEINLAPFARPGETAHVVIRAVDRTDPQQPTGKQVNWYTRNSGIWQTVYLEARHVSHVVSWRYTSDIKTGQVRFRIKLSPYDGKRFLTVMSPDAKFYHVTTYCGEETDTFELIATIRKPKLWSPDSPTTYPIDIHIADGDGVLDTVSGYVALREISVANAPGREYPYIQLNGRPLYLLGALHQSFHPDGIYHYPSDAVMRSDYELCRQIGLNMLRIHIKTPIPRELYHADQLGILIMQDIPCFWKYTPRAQAWFEQLMRGAIERDFNHPSIFAWVVFNETWGIGDGGYGPDRHKWVEQMYRLARELDPSRLVEDNSPCNYDHVTTDINSWHFYNADYETVRKHVIDVVERSTPGSDFNCAKGYTLGNVPLMNSEYGGIGAGSGDQDISWCFKFLTNELRKHAKICGYVYTELSDIEWEHNGFVNYDRSAKTYNYDYWHPGFTLRDINSLDYVVIDSPPMLSLVPGEQKRVPVRVSHYSEHEAKDLKLRWRLRNPLTEQRVVVNQAFAWESRPATWKPFDVVEQEPIVIKIDEGRDPLALLVELVDGETVLARNYINIENARAGPTPGVRAVGADRLVLSFAPGDYADNTFTGIVPPPGSREGTWVSMTGAGAIEYDLKLPEGVNLDTLQKLFVTAEVASRSGEARIDWPARRTASDAPQTDGKKWPTDVRVTVNGVEVTAGTIPDDPADAKGALSHAHGLQGRYGFPIGQVPVTDARLKQIADAARKDGVLHVRFSVPADAKNRGGLTLFGEGVGLRGAPPTVSLRFAGTGHGLPVDFRQASTPAIDRVADRVQVPLPTAEAGGHLWRLTPKDPGPDWSKPGFDDSKWRQGKGSFGMRGTPGAIISTRWDRPDIWLRTRLNVADPANILSGMWRIYHDEDIEIDINGVRAFAATGYTTGYVDVPMSPEALKLLRAGENVIAVHCHQREGGQNVDVGLTLMTRPNRAAATSQAAE